MLANLINSWYLVGISPMELNICVNFPNLLQLLSYIL